MQDTARALEAAGGVAPMQIGAVKGNGNTGKDVKGKGKGEVMQAERDDVAELAEKNEDKQCFDCQWKGQIKSDCRYLQRDMKKATVSRQQLVDKQAARITDHEINGTVIEGIHVFAVTEKPSLCQQMEGACCSHDHHLRARASVSA